MVGSVLIANPGADVYGSDLQMLESVSALVAAGHRVTVAIPSDGPLVSQIRERGAEVRLMRFPVLRRTDQSVTGLLRLAGRIFRDLPGMSRLLRSVRADLVYVNTVTIPWWLIAGRLTRTPTVCHVHEAEDHDGVKARLAIYAPLALADRLIMISKAAEGAAVATVGKLATRSTIIRNGVPDRPDAPVAPPRESVLRVGVVARLSPRKGTLDALEAVSRAVAAGVDCELHLHGSVFPGYEWYENELRERAAQPDLAGRVHFHGYTRPVWPAFDAMDVILAPSHIEPYGNSVVEAQLSMRPVVASKAAGHLESIEHGATGLLVDVGDHRGMADAVRALAVDADLAADLARRARTVAAERNSVDTYRQAVADLVGAAQKASR